jgi:hypothetical protein
VTELQRQTSPQTGIVEKYAPMFWGQDDDAMDDAKGTGSYK